jgi:acyl-CoA thioesterase
LSEGDWDARAGGRFADELGIETVELTAGSAILRMKVRSDMVNANGVCHGGAIFAFADSAAGAAAWSRERNFVAQQASINWLRPAMEGAVLTAEAAEVSVEGRSAVYDVTVKNEQGAPIAVVRNLSREIRA